MSLIADSTILKNLYMYRRFLCRYRISLPFIIFMSGDLTGLCLCMSNRGHSSFLTCLTIIQICLLVVSWPKIICVNTWCSCFRHVCKYVLMCIKCYRIVPSYFFNKVCRQDMLEKINYSIWCTEKRNTTLNNLDWRLQKNLCYNLMLFQLIIYQLWLIKLQKTRHLKQAMI